MIGLSWAISTAFAAAASVLGYRRRACEFPPRAPSRAAVKERMQRHFRGSVLAAWRVEEIPVTLYESKRHRLAIHLLAHLVDDDFDTPVQVAVLGAEG